MVPPSPGHTINCSETAKPYEADLKTRDIALTCASGCAYNIDQSDAGWEVWGMGPFRIDSHICRAALTANVIGHSGGKVTLTYAGEEPEFVPFGAMIKSTFCFAGMKDCSFGAKRRAAE